MEKKTIACRCECCDHISEAEFLEMQATHEMLMVERDRLYKEVERLWIVGPPGTGQEKKGGH